MTVPRMTKPYLLLGVFITTSGFTELFFKDDVYQYTQNRIAEIVAGAQPSAEISGLETEELTPYVPYRLKTQNLSPFILKDFVSEVGQRPELTDSEDCADGCGDGPPLPHTPFVLEGYPLDQLTMAGTLSDPHKGEIALVQTPDKGIVNAAVGEYIGRNYGLILSISRERMIIQEKYRSTQGWQNRNAVLPLIRN